jgi:hypothetical protein
MNPEEIVQAWKDPDHMGPSVEAGHPAGEIVLDPHHGGWSSEFVVENMESASRFFGYSYCCSTFSGPRGCEY